MTLTAQRLREVLDYDPQSGVFTWRISNNGRQGQRAGSINTGGHRQIEIGGRSYVAHRLAWLHVHGEWPSLQLDHKNGQKDDNRLVNLRPATGSQNCANAKRRRDNTSGLKGVSWHPRQRKWIARLGVDGRIRHLGCFEDKAEAHEAYIRAASECFLGFARAA